MIHRNELQPGDGTTPVRVRLMAMAEALDQRHDELRAAWEFVREEVVDDVDNAQRVSDTRFSAALDSAIDEARASIAHALDVLDAGGYGVCEDCGAPISEARLAFRPESTRCLACQRGADIRGAANPAIAVRNESVRQRRPNLRSEVHDGRVVPLRRLKNTHPNGGST